MNQTHKLKPLYVQAWQRPARGPLDTLPLWVAKVVNVQGTEGNETIEVGGQVQSYKDNPEHREMVKGDWLVSGIDGIFLYDNFAFQGRFEPITADQEM